MISRKFLGLSLMIVAVAFQGVLAQAASRKVDCKVNKSTETVLGAISFVALSPSNVGYLRMDGYDTYERGDRYFVKGPVQADPNYKPHKMVGFDAYDVSGEYNRIQLVVPKNLTMIKAMEFPAYVRIEADGGVRDSVTLDCRFVR